MRILITGGNGFVGRAVTRVLDRDHDVTIADSLRFGGLRFNDTERASLDVRIGDLRDESFARALLNDVQPDGVVHLAAIHYVPECNELPSLAVSTNLLATVNLLAHCPAGCRVVFASSGAVYKPSELAHTEEADVQPVDVYGWTKLHGEHYLGEFARRRDLAGVVVRLFNVIGPGETNPHVLPEIIAQLKAGRTSLRLGNLSPRRDYVDVVDAAEGFAAVISRGHVAPGAVKTVNLGTQSCYSVAELLDHLRSAGGIDFTVDVDPLRVRASDRPVLLADRSRIEREFGWSPKRTLDQTLAETWEAPELLPELVAKYQL